MAFQLDLRPFVTPVVSEWTVILNWMNRSMWKLSKVKKFDHFLNFEEVVHAFISTWHGYCRGLWLGVRQSSLSHLQLVQMLPPES